MPTDRWHFPIWLWYALLGVFFWGLWGFLSKIGSDTASPMQMQILFTLGMLSLADWQLPTVAPRNFEVLPLAFRKANLCPIAEK